MGELSGRRLNRKQSTRIRKSEESGYNHTEANKLQKLLFMRPKNPPSAEPVMDDITKLVTKYWAFNKRSKYMYKGTHQCSCHVSSTNSDHFIGPNYDILTNSLCLHYVQFHRDEIPQDELDRVVSLLTPAED